MIGMMLMLLVMLVPVVKSYAFSEAGDEVSLQLQLIVANQGVLVSGEKTVIVRLKSEGEIEMQLIWEKEYPGVYIQDGVLSLSLSGADNQSRQLIADMFDKVGLQLEVEIDGEVVSLDMVSQPYAIKSRISDESHSAKSLQGIPVRAVSEVSEGDVLVVKDGEWVPTGAGDGHTGSSSELDRINSIEGLNDVRLSGVNEGEILGYNGNQWVNVADQRLSEADVDAIISEKGYIKEVGASSMQEGEYDKIKGIGGKIKVDPTIQLDDHVSIKIGRAHV